MAVTTAGRALTEAHRVGQITLSKDALRDFLAVWKLLDPKALDATFPDYSRAARLVISANRAKSTSLAVAYLTAFRQAEGVTEPLTAARAAEIAEEQAMTSLLVTGPVTARQQLGSGASIDDAMRRALVSSSGAVMRHVLNGGRETISASVDRDPAAFGVARVTDGAPCYFCAMLAGRGAVYKSEETASFKCHDGCGCSVEPVYDRDTYQLPASSQKFADLYAGNSDGRGAEKLLDFRRAYEGRKA